MRAWVELVTVDDLRWLVEPDADRNTVPHYRHLLLAASGLLDALRELGGDDPWLESRANRASELLEQFDAEPTDRNRELLVLSVGTLHANSTEFVDRMLGQVEMEELECVRARMNAQVALMLSAFSVLHPESEEEIQAREAVGSDRLERLEELGLSYALTFADVSRAELSELLDSVHEPDARRRFFEHEWPKLSDQCGRLDD